MFLLKMHSLAPTPLSVNVLTNCFPLNIRIMTNYCLTIICVYHQLSYMSPVQYDYIFIIVESHGQEIGKYYYYYFFGLFKLFSSQNVEIIQRIIFLFINVKFCFRFAYFIGTYQLYIIYIHLNVDVVFSKVQLLHKHPKLECLHICRIRNYYIIMVIIFFAAMIPT